MSDEDSRTRAADGAGAVLTVSLKDVVMGGVVGPVSSGLTRAQMHGERVKRAATMPASVAAWRALSAP